MVRTISMRTMGLIAVAALAATGWTGHANAQSAPLMAEVELMKNYMKLKQTGKAMDAAERAMQLARHELDHDKPYLADIISSVADLYVLHQFYAQAIPLYSEAILIREGENGIDDPELGPAFNNLALVYKAMGQYEDAEPYVQRAIAIKEKNFGSDHPSLAPSLEIYARVLRETGREEQAEEYAARAKTVRESQ